MNQSAALSDAIGLFKTSPPFEELDHATLEELAATLIEESYQRGGTLVDVDGEHGSAVRIIKKGAVKVTIPFGRNDEALVDYRGVGEIFGYLALLTGDHLRGEIVFLEDTVCYRIERRAVLRLLQRHPHFARQFFATFLHKYVAKPYRELGKKKLFYGGGDRLLFTTPVGELITRPLITAAEDVSIRQAAETMAANRVSSLVLLDRSGLPAGIITNSDMRDKVVARGRDSEQPVRRIHSQSLVKVEAGDLCIEALFKMYHYRIHHLLVLDNGRPKGIVTTHDLMKLQGKSPVSIVREIEERHSLTELVSPVRRLHDLLGHFLDEGVKATHVLRIASEICDRLLCKVLEMAQKSTGPSPLPWCFLVYGNRGRQEQVSPGLENSAVVYANPRSEEEERLVQEYFRRFSFSARRKFAEIAALSGSVAGTEDHEIRCQSLATWENTFSRWIGMTQPAAVAEVVEMFDYRCLFGDRRLVDDLDKSIRALLADKPEFFRTMAAAALDNSPPLPGSPRETGASSLPDDCSFVHHGVTPLVDIVRLLALENRVWETNTPERLRLLGELPTPIHHHGAELTTAFDVICGCSLHHRYQQIRQGQLFSPLQYVAQLNNLERKILHEAFVAVGEVQGLLGERFAL
jgi:CBS domain-containing protein